MAINVLFGSSKDNLKQSLRLSGTVQADSLQIIDQAIQEVRVGFYEALGAARIAQINSASLVENPTSSAGILRAKAAHTEVMWVRLLLLRRLPSLFIDGGGNASQVWNEEGFLRDFSKSDREREIERLLNEVQNNLTALSSGETTEDPQVQIDVIGPEAGTVRVMGSSIFPGNSYY